jgi:hypothetical protein
MKISKKVLGTLNGANETAVIKFNNENHYLFASDGYLPCVSFAESSLKRHKIWDGPGGTGSLVPIPQCENEFYATQKCFPPFRAEESVLVHVKYDASKGFDVTPILTIPYLHRFDVFLIGQKLFFIGATLCEGKKHQADWSLPGKVYVGQITNGPQNPFEIQPIIQGITKNHGFYKGTWKGKNSYLFSGKEGVFVVYIPKNAKGRWEIEKILHHEVGEIAVLDIDGDGIEELATIEPFHGSLGRIYKLTQGRWFPFTNTSANSAMFFGVESFATCPPSSLERERETENSFALRPIRLQERLWKL